MQLVRTKSTKKVGMHWISSLPDIRPFLISGSDWAAG